MSDYLEQDISQDLLESTYGGHDDSMICIQDSNVTSPVIGSRSSKVSL